LFFGFRLNDLQQSLDGRALEAARNILRRLANRKEISAGAGFAYMKML